MAGMFSKAASALTGRTNENKTQEEGESLTTILRTPEDRSALTLLVADCTEAMRQSIKDAFDANETGTNTSLDMNELKEALPKSETEPSEQDQEAKAKEEQKLQEKQVKELAQREKELTQAEMQDLKHSALQNWDKWRSAVIQRIGEVLNSQEDEQVRKQHETSEEQQSHSRAASPPMNFEQPPMYDKVVNETMKRLYPPIDNPLKRMSEANRALIMHALLLLLLSLEHYHAESRVLLLRMSTSLDVPIDVLGLDESKVARGLLAAAENMNADEETKKKADENKTGRRWKVGLATVAGAALIGVTGGLAAPLLAAGVGTVMGGIGLAGTATAGYLGALAGSGVLVGGLFGAYGGRMTGKMMDQYAREVEDFAFEPVRTHHRPRKIEKEFRRLRVAIGISGWLTDEKGVVEPWKVIGAQLESFALRWELEALMNLGNAITTLVTSAAWSYAKAEIIKRTLFGALTAGLWPLAILKVGKVIDNPFSVANYRAQKAGEVLADALINKAQGERPVTLIGFSLGGKVIFACLKSLAQRKAFGLVENAILIGTPAPSAASDWRMIRSVVSGRVVNIYSTKDYVLGFLYRSHTTALGIAGLQAVEHVKGVENVDVSSLVSGHTRYRHLTGPILKEIGFEDVDVEVLAEEERLLKEQDEQEETERLANEKSEKGSTSSAGEHDVDDAYVEKMQQEVQKKNEQSYVGWMQGKMTAAGSNVSTAYEKAKAQWKSRTSSGNGKAPTAQQPIDNRTVPDHTDSSDGQAPPLPPRTS